MTVLFTNLYNSFVYKYKMGGWNKQEVYILSWVLHAASLGSWYLLYYYCSDMNEQSTYDPWKAILVTAVCKLTHRIHNSQAATICCLSQLQEN